MQQRKYPEAAAELRAALTAEPSRHRGYNLAFP